MYINVAYVDDENPNLEDLSVPLRINNCGYYRVHTTPIIETPHPEGRNDYQLLYIAHGKGHFYFKNTGQETIVQKGNMILFRPGEPQVYYYYATDKTEVYWVHFTGSQVEQYLEHYELPKDENVFYTGVSPDYPWIYNQIIRELQLQRVNYEEVLEVLLRHAFLTINRYIKEGKQTKNEMVDEIERATHYFKENYNKNISIEQYAQEHLMSINSFINHFKSIMKYTPMQYIISLRISAAKGYFDSTNKNVSEVADAVGYDNSLYFSRVFKKYTGYSPSEYRKMISELDEKNTGFEQEPVELFELSKSVTERMKPVAEKRNITLNVLGGTAKVMGVSKILEEMIENLVDNAVKYNKDNGTVDVIVTSSDNTCELVVRDTGIGIPQSEQSRVFERFYCVDKSHSKLVGGTGLGLSIVKHGAMFHNAQIKLESTEGKGTSISLIFNKA